jgi:DNA modification methylase
VFTDPPYNVDYQGGMNASGQNNREGIQNDKMSQTAFFTFLSDFIKQAMGVCSGAFYICMGNSQIHTLRNAFDEGGGHWQNNIIWVKNHFTITRGDYQHQYEVIMYGYNAKTVNHYFVSDRNIPNVYEDLQDLKTHYDGEYTSIKFQGFEVKIKGKAEGTVMKKRQKTDIWRYDKPSRSEEHPTMKPVAMVCEAINNSSHRESIVYDPFGGSGSTLIACEKLNRKCRMMEIDPIYVDVIIQRWEKMFGQKATKVEN